MTSAYGKFAAMVATSACPMRPQWKGRADRRVAVLARFPFTLPYQIVGDEDLGVRSYKSTARLLAQPEDRLKQMKGRKLVRDGFATPGDPDGIRTPAEAKRAQRA